MKVKILKTPKAEQGIKVPQGTSGLYSENNSISKIGSPYSNIFQVNGKSHLDGGEDVMYGNQTVEMQGGEPIIIAQDGSANAMGKMFIPGTSTKFDSAAKTIAKDEAKVAKSNSYSNNLVQESDPTNKYQSLKFNSGKVMLDGNAQKSKELNAQKETLASIQDTMHRIADNMGIEPQDLSSNLKAKYGISLNKMKAYDGTTILGQQKQMLQDHPDWVQEALNQYGQPKAGRFDDGMDGPRTQYVKNYVAQKNGPSFNFAGDNNGNPNYDPYNTNDIKPLVPLPINQLTTNVPEQLNKIPQSTFDYPTPDQDVYNTIPNSQMPVTPMTPYQSSRNFTPVKNKLGIWDILPEAVTALEQPQPVPGHSINSYLQSPYNVSFQDRKNDNMSTFNSAAKSQVNNPAVIGGLAGQNYVANNNVNAEEFRTNQGIYNQITGENYNTMNSDKKMQLQLDMEQEDKQARALAYTRRDKFDALSSLANKESDLQRSNFTNSMYYNMGHERGIDANGKLLHEDTGVIGTPYVPLMNKDEDQTKIYKQKGFRYDPRTGKKLEEDDVITKSKFGKKITKLPTSTYTKL